MLLRNESLDLNFEDHAAGLAERSDAASVGIWVFCQGLKRLYRGFRLWSFGFSE